MFKTSYIVNLNKSVGLKGNTNKRPTIDLFTRNSIIYVCRVQDFFYLFIYFIKISYLECMFNFRAPWHVLLLF